MTTTTPSDEEIRSACDKLGISTSDKDGSLCLSIAQLRALLAQPAAAGQGEAATQDKLDSLLEAAQYLSHRRRVAAAPPATQGQDAAPAERDALQARVDAEPEGFTQGIDAAAKMLDKMADDYSRAHAIQDPDTGVYEFGRGAKEDYYNTLRELADDVRSIVYAPGERENAAQTLKAAKDAAFEQAANLVELEYAPDAKAGKRLAQIARHIRDLKKRSS